MKKIWQKVSSVCMLALALGSSAAALEVSELTPTMTRGYADKHFSKDYNYRILEDNTVRRTWTADGRSIIIDFDIRTEKTVSIFIVYEPAAGKREALADVKVLTEGRRDGANWFKPKKDAAEKVGLKKSRLMRLADKSLLFWETSGKEECSRLCWFATAPTINRMTLGDANEFSGRTALGSSGMTGASKQLRADEERRMRIEPVPVESAVAVAKPAPRPAGDAEPAVAQKPTPVQKPTVAPVKKPEPVAVVPAAPVTDELDVPEDVDTTENEESANILQALGIQADDEMVKWAAIGGGVLLLLIFWGGISSARRKARQRSQFEKLLRGGDAGNEK